MMILKNLVDYYPKTKKIKAAFGSLMHHRYDLYVVSINWDKNVQNGSLEALIYNTNRIQTLR